MVAAVPEPPCLAHLMKVLHRLGKRYRSQALVRRPGGRPLRSSESLPGSARVRPWPPTAILFRWPVGPAALPPVRGANSAQPGYKITTFTSLPNRSSRGSVTPNMSKIFVNENPQGQAPAQAVARSADTIHNVAKLLAILFGVAIAIGFGSLLYHHWKFALAFLMAIVVFACGSSRVVAIGCMCVLLLMLALLGNSAKAQTAVDGDTIKLNGTTFRIWGIDAAEARQVCRDGWMAGKEASKAMLELLSGHKIACEAKDKDRYGRTVALCRANGRDLGAAMVSAGMAWAFTRYSSDYIGQERAAISARLGVHKHDCEKPWDWRKAPR